jgi:hypothetical protein
MAKIKKAQNGVTKDSLKSINLSNMDKQYQKQSIAKSNNNKEIIKQSSDKANQKLVEKLPKKKMKNGGSLSGLTASNKRDKGTDVGGAWTTVQKKTLAGAKGKAKLTADKQLGATKMTAKRGMKISKKK